MRGRGVPVQAGSSGFTLIELIVSMVIVAILLALAAPSFRNMILDSRRSSVANELMATLQLARIEALKLSRDAFVCPTVDTNPSDGVTCSNVATNWSKAWAVVQDVNGDGDRDDAGDVLKYQSNESDGLDIRVNGITNATFRYRPFQVGMQGGTIALCDPRGGNHRRSIVVSDTGRPRVQAGAPAGLCP